MMNNKKTIQKMRDCKQGTVCWQFKPFYCSKECLEYNRSKEKSQKDGLK